MTLLAPVLERTPSLNDVKRATKKTFHSLSVRNFRLYFIGQMISVAGTWMQSVAQGWLVLKLTGSAFDLGLVVALQFLPLLLLGSWGGVLVDRLAKRRIRVGTQVAAGLLALTLGLLAGFGHIRLWEVLMMAGLLGFVNVLDNPARQAFVQEMVGREKLANAVSLNSVLMNSGRVLGPALAGFIIATWGIPACFYANALSFAAVLVALLLMDASELSPIKRAPKQKGQLVAGFRYAVHTDRIRNILVAVGIVGIFAFNFTVTLPLLAEHAFGGTAATYGLLMSSMGLGAILGGLVVAHRARPTLKMLSGLCLAFGILMIGVAAAPSEWVALVLLVFMGATSIAFLSTANASLQLNSKEEMRGRVMSLYSIAFLGSTPIGAPLIGLVCATTGARTAIALGGVATMLASVPLLLVLRERRLAAAPVQHGAGA